jgi:hypothetical protein
MRGARSRAERLSPGAVPVHGVRAGNVAQRGNGAVERSRAEDRRGGSVTVIDRERHPGGRAYAGDRTGSSGHIDSVQRGVPHETHRWSLGFHSLWDKSRGDCRDSKRTEKFGHV